VAHPLFVIDLDPDAPVSDEDIEAVLHPEPFERVCRVTDPADATMEALAARAGVFPSRGRARKNGFAGPVPHGLDLFGAGGRSFFVWNPRPPAKRPTIGKKRSLWRHWENYLTDMQRSGIAGPWSPPDLDAMRATWAWRRIEGTWEMPFREVSTRARSVR